MVRMKQKVTRVIAMITHVNGNKRGRKIMPVMANIRKREKKIIPMATKMIKRERKKDHANDEDVRKRWL